MGRPGRSCTSSAATASRTRSFRVRSTFPAWRGRRDGRSVSFLAKRGKDERRSLYQIPAEGGEARRLLAYATDITAYAWSPDGKRVAFLAVEEAPKKQREQEKKGFTQEVLDESARAVRIFVASPGEDAKPRLIDIKGSASELSWSPAGSLLAVALAPTAQVDDSLMSRKATVVDADSGQVVTQIPNPGKLGPMAWSSDGRTLAYVSAADVHDPSAGRLMVAPAGRRPFAGLAARLRGQRHAHLLAGRRLRDVHRG